MAKKLSVAIRRKNRARYDGFPSLDQCWSQTEEHRKFFLSRMKCNERRNYHEGVRSCKEFDDMIESLAGMEYKHTYFRYFKVVGRKPRPDEYLDALSDRQILPKLAELAIVKKTRAELHGAGIPGNYSIWPSHFTVDAAIAVLDPEDIDSLLVWIEHCIKRRLLFRNICVRACNKRIDTDTHDHFLLILQILRARLIHLNDAG